MDRNHHKHRKDNLCSEREIQLGDRAISRLYTRLQEALGQEDEYLLNLSVDDLLQKSWTCKKEWIAQAEVVYQRLHSSIRLADRCQAQQDRVRPNRRVRAGSRRELWEHLAQNMARWLRSHRNRSEVRGGGIRTLVGACRLWLAQGSFWSFTSHWEVFAGDIQAHCAVVNIVTINHCVIYLETEIKGY